MFVLHSESRAHHLTAIDSTHLTGQAENVTKALVRAVTAEKHRPQYVVGMDGRFFMVPVMMLPRRCV